MGYYTTYTLNNWDDEEAFDEEAFEELKAISGYSWDDHQLSEAKWYCCLEDAQKVADKFPNCRIEVECMGEVLGDYWWFKIEDGKVWKARALITQSEYSIVGDIP